VDESLEQSQAADGAAAEAPQAGPLGREPGEQPEASPGDVAAPGKAVVERLLWRLRGICGADQVITQSDQLRTYQSDGLLQYRVVPRAAVLPGTGEEVRDVIRACQEAEVPWVARGAGSGLSGGALPIEEGVLIVLTRLRRILEVDLANQTVVCEPGVSNVAISQAAGPSHFFPPDPSSQVVCSIGGNVAENSGGAHCFKYGFTTNYVVGLEIVLPDGEVVTLGGKQAGLPGYDLLGAFVGSEGTLGVATKITLRVVPSPETTRTLVAFFDTTSGAGQVVSDIVTAGTIPAAIEMMDKLTIRACEEMAGAGFPLDVGAALLVELDGSEAECQTQFDEVQEVCRRHGASEIRVAEDKLERELMWKMRKSAFPAMGRISPHYYVQDSVIPRTRLSEVLTRIDELAEEYGLEVANVFHAGDGNLHPLVCYDGHSEGEAERAEELAGEIVLACVEAGGSITGEHGVGVDKKRYMPEMFDEPDLAAFQKLRCAFDPDGRANPGKVMPTPRLCGEVPGPYRQHPLEVAGLAERF
jgi:glycolate oxidase